MREKITLETSKTTADEVSEEACPLQGRNIANNLAKSENFEMGQGSEIKTMMHDTNELNSKVSESSWT